MENDQNYRVPPSSEGMSIRTLASDLESLRKSGGLEAVPEKVAFHVAGDEAKHGKEISKKETKPSASDRTPSKWPLITGIVAAIILLFAFGFFLLPALF